MKGIKITTNSAANHYANKPHETIIEFMDLETGIGGLISFHRFDDQDGNHKLKIDVYRTDPGIVVIGPTG